MPRSATATTAILTPGRRRALEVLAATHPRPGTYSNSTAMSVEGAKVALVAADEADWLLEQSLVTFGGPKVDLSTAGLIACRAAGIEVRNA